MAERNPNSKMSQARVIVTECLSQDPPLARKDVIARLVDEVGLTKAGAATYFQKIRTELRNG